MIWDVIVMFMLLEYYGCKVGQDE